MAAGQDIALGPGQPMMPAHPEEHDPRRFDYRSGFNLGTPPRAYEGISFAQLRSLCANYSVARIAIEARKDEARGWDWDVTVKPLRGLKQREQQERARSFDPEVERIRGFLQSPNQEDDFGTWLVEYLEDLFVIDAPTLYLRQARGSGLYSVESIDGATIKPLVDAWGKTPTLGPTASTPRAHVHDWQGAIDTGVLITCTVCNWPAAYAQVIKGVTWGYYTTYELLYEPYHQDNQSPYGSPPMEWVLLNVNRALRRESLDLSNFTEGTLPLSYFLLPEGWTPQQVAEMQEIFDKLMGGDDLARSRVRFMPGGPGAGPARINPDPTTEVEKWLMNLVAAAFGTSAQELGFTPDSGLGGAGYGEASRVSAEKRGVRPLARHVKGLLDRIIAGPLEAPELEFTFRGLAASEDVLAVAQANQIRNHSGALSADEWRIEDGRDPIGLGPTVFDPKIGVVLVSDLLANAALTAGAAAGLTAAALDPTGVSPAAAEAQGAEDAPDAVASALPGQTTIGAGIEPVDVFKSADLGRWRRKALKAIADGRDPSRFTSESIDPATVAAVRDRLVKATSAADVRAAFAPEVLAVSHALDS